jgi:hypothetical protein
MMAFARRCKANPHPTFTGIYPEIEAYTTVPYTRRSSMLVGERTVLVLHTPRCKAVQVYTCR